jgi:hypothetical protein
MTKRNIVTASDLLASAKQGKVTSIAENAKHAARLLSTGGHKVHTDALTRELQVEGVAIESVWDLVNKPVNRESVVKVLLNHVGRDYDKETKEGICRALAVSKARGKAAIPLIREFRRAAELNLGSLCWAIANTLSVVSDDSVDEDLIRLVQNPSSGKSREMLVVALGKVGTPRAVKELLNLIDDDDLCGYAVDALGKLRVKAAREKIVPLTAHRVTWIRNAARVALKRIGN